MRSLRVIPNRSESIRKLVKKLGAAKELRVRYETGPTEYAVYWVLSALGVRCEVVAPTLVPMKARETSPPSGFWTRRRSSFLLAFDQH